MTKKTKQQKEEKNNLVNLIVMGLEEKKAKDITILDLRELPNAVCQYFVIATGDSTTQVAALSDSVYDMVFKESKEKPWHIEGEQNAEWVLVDYSDVVCHIFLPEVREFYGIEDLWADAQITLIEH